MIIRYKYHFSYGFCFGGKHVRNLRDTIFLTMSYLVAKSKTKVNIIYNIYTF